MTRNTAAVLSLSMVLALALGLWIAQVEGRSQRDSASAVSGASGMTRLDPPRPLTGFALHDTRNQPFNLARLRGHWSFLFFGYTHCTDVCPTTLATFKQLHSLAGGVSHGVQYVFVSVDPQRDSAGVLARYVGRFDPEFIGATGNDAELSALTRQMGVYYKRHAPGRGGNYEVDHTSVIFLIDPQARLCALFSELNDPRAIARGFKALPHDH